MQRSLCALTLALGLAACDQAAQPAQTVDVTVLGLNDFHGNLLPTGFAAIKVPDPADPTRQINLPSGGVEAIGGLLNDLRAQNPNTLLVGGGDLIGASPVISSLLRDEPSVIALSKLGMRASALGNHEFDQGLKELLRMQNGGCDSNAPDKACKFEAAYPGADFQWLGANVVYKQGGAHPFAPYHIETTAGGARIGFIGAVLRDTPTIVSPAGVADLDFLDEATAINRYVPELLTQKVDAIVVLIHQGGTTTEAYDKAGCTTLTGPIVDIARQVRPEVAAIISGHSHQGYNCVVNGRVVIQGDQYGHLLQRLDLKVDKANHKVLEVRAENVVVNAQTQAKDAAMTDLVGRAQALTKAISEQPVANLAAPQISRTNNVAGESALGDVIADAQLAATSPAANGGAQIALMNPGGIRADLPGTPRAGNAVTFGDVFAVQPFGNTLVVMTLTGAQIDTLLEQQWLGQQNPRILQVSAGFAYTYDLAQAAGSRVDAASITLNGAPLDPAGTYRVAVNSFLAGGGDNFTVLREGVGRLEQPNLVDVDVLAAYLKAAAPVAPGAQNRITRLN
ncbi:bifunctional metallophosphatase/5'-nucleotidase [Deinococcus sp. YIM 134068]|uniref:bifunctional metallophosphatase/5'-nucleotidase n=1 Tax=Deinococcus lichenicola TaxID=3118910 RepID=UPI002F9540B0